jgi:Tol biopolymer transport system component
LPKRPGAGWPSGGRSASCRRGSPTSCSPTRPRSNAYATPLPYDTIVIYPVWPPGSDFDFEDWLRLSFTHEFTHIVHLDRSEGWARVVRSVLGRSALAFPNVFLPAWQIEGLAVFEESVLTGTGRLHEGDFRAIVDEAARAGRLEPLDRTNGGLTDWPGGAAVYAYGAGFHQYLAERYGAATLAELAAATARRLPYTASRAFERLYGEPLGRLWRDYESSVAARVASPAATTGSAAPTRLTHHGFSVRGPRFDRFPCAGCAPEIVYSVNNADGFPALYRIGLDGGAPRRLTTRFLGSTTAIGRDRVYFDQIEIRRNTGGYSDLYALSRADGRVRALTREARLFDPDLSPDGETIVCVQDRTGRRDLVTLRAPSSSQPDVDAVGAGITMLVGGSDTYFDAPKWSPDGRRVAVERHRLGAMPEVVVVDVATTAVRVVATDATTRFVMPAWRPDGAAIVAAVAPKDQVFNLVEFNLEGGPARQLTATTGGATWPDVSADGGTIAFVGYTADGFDVFTVPYPAAAAAAVQDQRTQDDRAAIARPGRAALRVDERRATARDLPTVEPPPTVAYSPLRTLKPTSWFPVVETGGDQVRVGASVGGVDVLGYHGWFASATWLVSAPTGVVGPPASSPDWQAYYVYDRWRPRFYAAASKQTSFFTGPASDAGTPTAATRRERHLEGGVVFPMRRVRASHAALLSVLRSVDDLTLVDGTVSRARTPLRASWQTVTRRTYGYSISPEHGLAAGATAELVRTALGSFADATTITGDVRGYLPGLAPHHVVALRLSGGASTGDPMAGRTFLLGGDTPAPGVADFGSSDFSLLRGFRDHTFAGTHVALINAEYRWPIARPQRGVGTWPIFIHSLHGALFADAGHAWTRAFNSRAIKTSAGAQLSADFIAGYFAPLTATFGVAWGHDGSGVVADGVTAYFRVGKAF